MSMFRIPAYDTTAIGDGFIDVSVRDWQPLSIRGYILMRKSLALADRLAKRDPQGIEPKHKRKAANRPVAPGCWSCAWAVREPPCTWEPGATARTSAPSPRRSAAAATC